jgi:RNA polymerase sigma factor (sigma-70 family)
MTNRAGDHFRSARLRQTEPIDANRLPAPPLEEPDDCRWMQVTDEQFRAAVERLPAKFRQIFDLHEVHHVPYQDIAARLNIPVNTVASRLRRAREKLSRLLARSPATTGKGEARP